MKVNTRINLDTIKIANSSAIHCYVNSHNDKKGRRCNLVSAKIKKSKGLIKHKFISMISKLRKLENSKSFNECENTKMQKIRIKSIV